MGAVYPGEIATRVVAGDLRGAVGLRSEKSFPAQGVLSLPYAVQGTIDGLVSSLPEPGSLGDGAPRGAGTARARLLPAPPLGGSAARPRPAALRRPYPRAGGLDPGAQPAWRGAAARRGDTRGPLPRRRLASPRRRGLGRAAVAGPPWRRGRDHRPLRPLGGGGPPRPFADRDEKPGGPEPGVAHGPAADRRGGPLQRLVGPAGRRERHRQGAGRPP